MVCNVSLNNVITITVGNRMMVASPYTVPYIHRRQRLDIYAEQGFWEKILHSLWTHNLYLF